MQKSSGYLVVSLLFSLGLACLIENRIFWDPLALNDDIRNQIYWLARITHPHLFSHDYIAAYFTQSLLISPSVAGLYSFLAHWIDPMVLSQFLPLLLAVVATFFLFRFCAACQDEVYAFWVSFTFNCAIWLVKNLAGGLPRAFFYPLLFCLLWAIQTRRWLIATLTLWLAAITYPPVLLLGLGILLAEAIVTIRNKQPNRSLLNYLGLSVAGSLAIAGWRLFSSSSQLFGPLTNASLAERMPDLYPGGRIVLYNFPFHPEQWAFPMNLLMFVLQRLPHLYIMIPLLAFAFVLWLYRKFLHPRLGSLLIPPILWRTLIVSGCLYLLAWWVLFYLYVPERYLEYTLFIMPSFILGGLVYILRQHYPAYSRQLAIGFMIMALTVTTSFSRSDLMRIPKQERTLYAFLKTLPEKGMIAAPPGLASNIPVYANRSVLLSNEAYIPFHQLYFREMKARLKDWLLAYYATDSRPVLSLLAKYHIDYLIIQQRDFNKNRLQKVQQRYYRAFSDSFFLALVHPHRRDYYLMHVPEQCIMNSSDSYRVIDTNCLSSLLINRP